MVKRLRTTIMLNDEDIKTLEKHGIDPKEYAKKEAIDRMSNDISEFMEVNHNNVVFDKGFQRFEVTLILAAGMNKEEEDDKK